MIKNKNCFEILYCTLHIARALSGERWNTTATQTFLYNLLPFPAALRARKYASVESKQDQTRIKFNIFI